MRQYIYYFIKKSWMAGHPLTALDRTGRPEHFLSWWGKSRKLGVQPQPDSGGFRGVAGSVQMVVWRIPVFGNTMQCITTSRTVARHSKCSGKLISYCKKIDPAPPQKVIED
jgi:hypothetical protein